jgi:hypothetical protein
MMEYISVREAERWGLTARMINYYCMGERIDGVRNIANVWLIPNDAGKPEDAHKGNGRCRAGSNEGCDI